MTTRISLLLIAAAAFASYAGETLAAKAVTAKKPAVVATDDVQDIPGVRDPRYNALAPDDEKSIAESHVLGLGSEGLSIRKVEDASP